MLQLIDENLLSFPVLFISGYLSEHENTYKKLLLRVTKTGDWWTFILFMLRGFAEQAAKSKISLIQLKKARKELKAKLFKMKSPLRQSNISMVIDHIFEHPTTHSRFMEEQTRIHWQTCSKYLKALTKLGVLTEQASGKYKFYKNQMALRAMVVKKSQVKNPKR